MQNLSEHLGQNFLPTQNHWGHLNVRALWTYPTCVPLNPIPCHHSGKQITSRIYAGWCIYFFSKNDTFLKNLVEVRCHNCHPGWIRIHLKMLLESHWSCFVRLKAGLSLPTGRVVLDTLLEALEDKEIY